MPQRHRLGLDQAANVEKAEPMVLEVGIDPLDEPAKSVDLLAGLRSHSAAPLLHALRFPRPLAFAVGKRPGADVVALGWRRCKYRHRTRRMIGQCGDVLARGVVGINQKLFRDLAIVTIDVVHHRRRQTRVVAPILHLYRHDDTLAGCRRDLRVISRASGSVGQPHPACTWIAERDSGLRFLLLVLWMLLLPL